VPVLVFTISHFTVVLDTKNKNKAKCSINFVTSLPLSFVNVYWWSITSSQFFIFISISNFLVFVFNRFYILVCFVSVFIIFFVLAVTNNLLLCHRHTHPFNGPLSGTTGVSEYQKDKTNLNFTEGRDCEWQWHQLDHVQVCILLQTDNHASTPPLSFLQAGCPSCHPSNSVKASTQWRI